MFLGKPTWNTVGRFDMVRRGSLALAVALLVGANASGQETGFLDRKIERKSETRRGPGNDDEPASLVGRAINGVLRGGLRIGVHRGSDIHPLCDRVPGGCV